MKILHVIPTLDERSGGPAAAIWNLSFGLARHGQEVTIYTTDGGNRAGLNILSRNPMQIKGVKVVYFPSRYLGRFNFSFPLFSALRRDIPGFDVVHIHALFRFPASAAAYLCRKLNKPYIIRTIGQLDPYLLRRHFISKSLYLRFFDLKNLKMAKLIHVTSEAEAEWLRQLCPGARTATIPLGLSADDFNYLPAYGSFRLKYPGLKDKKIILFLGRISFKKGLDILIKAFSILVKDRSDVCLVIAGPDDEGYGAGLKVILEKLNIADRAIFTGLLLGNDKLSAFRDSDVFVLPSYSENFGMVVIEAMACGTPVVISDKVGIHREINENKAGVVVECNETSLYEGINSVLNDTGLAQELSFNAKRMIKDYYDIDKVADKLIGLYKEIS
jgi:glycosyltransferase involved in cell wall biosynthesis